MGSATRRAGDLVVSALVAVNAFGEVDGPDDVVLTQAGDARVRVSKCVGSAESSRSS